MSGLIHIYYGDGKGKTTAALGAAIRAHGSGKKVMVVQFLKGSNTSELESLKNLGISVLRCDICKFAKDMDENEKEKIKERHEKNLREAFEKKPDFIVLDEVLDAVNLNLLDRESLKKVIRHKPQETEIILTGHTADEEFISIADYVTQMKKIKHPYDRGVNARKGVEY